ncbi:MAG TPA: hypothetical protein VN898_15440 [Candidatus Binatia bacterium]|nr:hypothetical protein [Candidatus Binatia bacterium]
MDTCSERNVAHKGRPNREDLALAALLLAALATAAASPAPSETVLPPTPRPPEIHAPGVPDAPAAGKGRLALHIGGNRRWCTFPDDRLVRPPEQIGRTEKRNEVFTFGYKFTLAAVRRGDADTVVMLFESPAYRTASWRPAGKVGASRRPPKGTIIIPEGETMPRPRQIPRAPETMVPLWEPQNRCVGFPEEMNFDLDAGTYDVYAAFDLLKGDGTWVHRTTGFVTDVPVEAARRTRLDGLINMGPGSERHVEFMGSSLEPDPGKPGPAGS